MDNGNVCLEFVKNKGKEQRVVEVFSISSDGQQVTVFHPGDRGRGVAVSDCPPSPLSACKTFTFQSLPGKYFKKYQYAARFIDLVRSKTPKVTMYTEKAKCMLMENSQPADFEATFYEGAKVSFSQRGICILEKEGTSLMLDSVKSSLHLNQDTRELVDYSEKCRQQCMQLEAVISAVQSNGILKNQLLPVIVGRRYPSFRRPSVHSQKASSIQSSASEEMHSSNDNHPPKVISAESPATVPCLDNTLMSTITATSISSKTSSTFTAATHEVIHPFFVENIGWASMLANGEIWVKFNDGTQLGVGFSATTLTYIDAANNVTKYQNNQLPPEVKEKLEKVTLVVEHLRGAKSSAASSISRDTQTFQHPYHSQVAVAEMCAELSSLHYYHG
ncbi:hypothetical protein C0Q70_05634 [Pomacea canaliculata]|uniref:Uncharacterized protein n=1 Tax=Pomacea canaliculata TaxID=400727 RepID=A0A2T7PLQ6_POMCA|nr:hypothetical protein C0Q70_05634 [Pomacea canaliculata]